MELEDFRGILINLFVVLIIITAVFWWYKHFYNPFYFPGLVERFLWGDFIVGVLLGMFYFPYEKMRKDVMVKRLRELHIVTTLSNGSEKIRKKIFKKLSIDVKSLSKRLPKPKFDFKPKKRGRKPKEVDVRKGVNWVFQVLLIGFLGLLLVREFWPGAFSFIDVNYFLVTVVVFGVLSILFGEEGDKKTVPITRKDYVFAGIMGVFGAVLVWYKTSNIGVLSYAIAVTSGVLIVMLSILILDENGENKGKSLSNVVKER